MTSVRIMALAVASLSIVVQICAAAEQAAVILHHGKIVTVDKDFSIAQAVAIQGEKLLKVGSDAEVLATKGPNTKVIDLQGKMVLPGLIDSHVHSPGAAMTEFDHPIPDMETIQDVLDYIKARTQVVKPGEWIVVRQVFITRLKEQRYPTRAEMDAAAPKNPVMFSTGPDASLNSLALKESGIDRNFQPTDGQAGYIEKDSKTGEPTGILRSCGRFVKAKTSGRPSTAEDQRNRLIELFADYNAVGLTGVIDRGVSVGSQKMYEQMLATGKLTVRVAASRGVGSSGPLDKVQESIREVAKDPLRNGGPMLKVIGIKMFLDGGMLTGSAYMRDPWGVSGIYAIDDPKYRGLLYIPKDRLLPMVRTTVETGMQFTAHSVGDGAVHTLLEVYDEIDKSMPVRESRPCLTHSNFMSAESVATAARLGVVIDIQPAWLYLDAKTLVNHFGYERLRYFQPLKSIFAAGGVVGGGSDHMQKIGSLRSVNPYNPFLGMWVTITRKAKGYEGQLHPEEALTREQAIRFYTINNAKLMFQEKNIGSLEAGKLADLVVLDTDLLTCPEDKIRETLPVATYLGGKLVFERSKSEAP